MYLQPIHRRHRNHCHRSSHHHADSARSLFHACLQLTDTVADAYAKALAAVLIIAFPYKTAAFGGGALVHILLEEVAGKGRQGEALVQEGLVDAQAIIKEAAALTLQHNPRRLSEDIQTDAPVMGQRLLCTAVGKEAPAIVTHAFTASR